MARHQRTPQDFLVHDRRVTTKPYSVRCSEANLVFSPTNICRKRILHGCPKGPFSPSAGKLCRYRQTERKLHKTIIEKRKPCLDSEAHGVFVLKPQQHGKVGFFDLQHLHCPNIPYTAGEPKKYFGQVRPSQEGVSPAIKQL